MWLSFRAVMGGAWCNKGFARIAFKCQNNVFRQVQRQVNAKGRQMSTKCIREVPLDVAHAIFNRIAASTYNNPENLKGVLVKGVGNKMWISKLPSDVLAPAIPNNC